MGRPLVSRGNSNRLSMEGENKSWKLQELKYTTQLQRTEYSSCPPGGVPRQIILPALKWDPELSRGIAVLYRTRL